MGSIVQSVVDELKTSFATTLPTYGESKHVYGLDKNSFRHNALLFSVKPAGYRNVAGPTKSLFIDGDFDLVLSTEYKNKNQTDEALRDAIEALHEAHEIVYKEWFFKSWGATRVLKVNELAVDAPEVDEENNVVSITARYNIKYRTGVL